MGATKIAKVERAVPVRAAVPEARAGGVWTTAPRVLLPAMLGLGLVLRLLLVKAGEFHGDTDTMRAWAIALATQPLSSFYAGAGFAAHMPGDLWLLWLVAELYQRFSPEMAVGEPGFLFLLKLVPALADVGVGAMLFLLGRRLAGPRAGLLAAAFYTFNPASLFLTGIWGQWDAVPTLVVLLALWLLVRGNPELAAPAVAYAALIKPPLIVLLPLVAVVFLRRYLAPHLAWARAGAPVEPLARSLRRAAAAVLLTAAVGLAVLLPFGVGVWPISAEWGLWERVRAASEIYPFVTLNAFNPWITPLAGNWAADDRAFLLGVAARTWGLLLLGIAAALVLVRVWRRPSDRAIVWGTLALLLALFVLPTRVHERDLFPAVAAAALAAALAPGLRWVAATLSATCLLNLVFVYALYEPGLDPGLLGSTAVVSALALVNLAALRYLLGGALPVLAGDRAGWLPRPLTGGWWHATLDRVAPTPAGVPAPWRTPWWTPPAPTPAATATAPAPAARRWALGRADTLAMGLLFVAAVALFLPRLTEIERYIYDEVYHAYTAAEYVAGNEDAYVWDTEPPREGVAYEWTHPPLGKLIIAGGILLFGDEPLGWRLPSVLFGALGVVVAYLLGRAVSGRRAVGVLAGGLLLLDGLWFVESRTAVLDVFLVVFTTGALLAGYRYLTAPPDRVRGPLLATGFLLGLAIATKWNASYAALLIGLVAVARLLWLLRQARDRRSPARPAALAGVRAHLVWVPLGLIALPFALYLLSYVPFFLQGNGVGDLVELQRQMWWYHSNLEAEHAYYSSWWEWPLALRPVWYSNEYLPHDVLVNVYAQPNPLLYWAFLPAVGWLSLRWWRERNPALVVLAIGFFGQWLPWILSPRQAYVYHFLPAVPFGVLAVAVAVATLARAGVRWRRAAIAYVAVVALAFAFFYPIYAGVPLTDERFELRIWTERWR